MRQWLNSSAVKGQWWTAQHVGDVAPIQLSTVNGFMAGLPEVFTNCMENLKITRALNTISEPDKDIISESYNAKVFLPSLEQMYIEAEAEVAADLDSEAWDYYKQIAAEAGLGGSFEAYEWYYFLGSCRLNSKYGATVYLASAYRDYSCCNWYISRYGYTDYDFTYYSMACRPACVI